MNEKMKKLLSMLLVLCMVLQYVPATAHAAVEDKLCQHHPEHNAACGYVPAVEGVACSHKHDGLCGYVEAVQEVLCACAETDENGALVHTEGCGYVAPVAGSDCTHTHDTAVCGFVQAVEGHECHYVCDQEHTEVPSEEPTAETPVCNCGTDSSEHSVLCAVYVKPETPVCQCYVKCEELNEWCDVCGFDYTACTGQGDVASYVTIPAGTKLYLKPNDNWKTDNARFAAYFFDSSGNTWVSMTAVTGETGVYQVTTPSGSWTNVIFCRMSPSVTTNSWSNPPCWNQTNDLTYNGTNNLYTVAEGAWTKGSGSWSHRHVAGATTYAQVDAESHNKVVSCSYGDDATVSTVSEPHSFGASNKCVCGAEAGAMIVISSEVYYATLAEAIEAVEGMCNLYALEDYDANFEIPKDVWFYGGDYTFDGTVTNNGFVLSGTFNGAVNCGSESAVFGGTFNDDMDNAGNIYGGKFNAQLTNNYGSIINLEESQEYFVLGENFNFVNNGGSVSCDDHLGGTAICYAKAACVFCGEEYGAYGKHSYIHYDYGVECENCDNRPEAQVGDTYYTTAEEAIANWKDNTTLKLLANASCDCRDASYEIGAANVTLDLNGYTLTVYDDVILMSGADVTICGAGGKLFADGSAFITVNSGAKVTLASGTVECFSYMGLDVSGTFNMTGGAVIGYTEGIRIPFSGAHVTISGGTVTGKNSYALSNGWGTEGITLSGGTFYGGLMTDVYDGRTELTVSQIIKAGYKLVDLDGNDVELDETTQEIIDEVKVVCAHPSNKTDATCKAQAVCAQCNQSYGELGDHSYNGNTCTTCGEAIVYYNLWVNGTEVTSRNAEDVLGNGKVVFNAETNTLTLNGATINVYKNNGEGYPCTILYQGDTTLIIEAKGYNYISTRSVSGGDAGGGAGSYGIYSAAPLVLKGNGYLEVNAGRAIHAAGVEIGEGFGSGNREQTLKLHLRLRSINSYVFADTTVKFPVEDYDEDDGDSYYSWRTSETSEFESESKPSTSTMYLEITGSGHTRSYKDLGNDYHEVKCSCGEVIFAQKPHYISEYNSKCSCGTMFAGLVKFVSQSPVEGIYRKLGDALVEAANRTENYRVQTMEITLSEDATLTAGDVLDVGNSAIAGVLTIDGATLTLAEGSTLRLFRGTINCINGGKVVDKGATAYVTFQYGSPSTHKHVDNYLYTWKYVDNGDGTHSYVCECPDCKITYYDGSAPVAHAAATGATATCKGYQCASCKAYFGEANPSKHIVDASGTCTLCGVTCMHNFGTNGVCSNCGAACEHSFGDDNVCDICGFTAKARIGNVYYATLPKALEVAAATNDEIEVVVALADYEGDFEISRAEFDGGNFTFSGDVWNCQSLVRGNFTGNVRNTGNISGGTFNGNVTNEWTINGGTFNGTVTNAHSISGVTFNGAVINNGTITNSAEAKITLGEDFAITNNGTINCDVHIDPTAASCYQKAVCRLCGEFGSVDSTVHASGCILTYAYADINNHTYTYSKCGTTGSVAHSFDANTSTCVCGVMGGYCGADADGKNLTWVYNAAEKELTITGSGAMADFTTSTRPWKKVGDSIHTIVIGEGVTSVGNCAFYYYCNSLYKVYLPSTLTDIGRSAFNECRRVDNFSIPSGVTTIDAYAFKGCAALRSVTIPGGVETIGESAFYECTGLTSLTLNAGLKTISEKAFGTCTNLETIAIPATVEEIKSDAFVECSALKTVNVSCSWNESALYTFDSGVDVKAADHTFNGDAECDACGYVCDHSGAVYTDNEDGTHTANCACGYEVTENHTLSYMNLTDATHTVYCTVCDYAVTSAHTYDATTHICPCGDVERFTITWKVEGEVVDTTAVTYGASVSAISCADKKVTEGKNCYYAFVGWDSYTDVMTMPAENLVFNAKFAEAATHVTTADPVYSKATEKGHDRACAECGLVEAEQEKHSFNPDTGLCACGYAAKAKLNAIFCATVPDALAAAAAMDNVYALADCDADFEIPQKVNFYGGNYTFTGDVTNKGNIYSGTFSGAVTNEGNIEDGTFKGEVANISGGEIRNGNFSGAVTNRAKIDGGNFDGNVTNAAGGSIRNGNFNGEVTNISLLYNGVFNGEVINRNGIYNGTFKNKVTNSALIYNGTFEAAVENGNTIYSGVFTGTVTNAQDICGGEFGGKVVNKATVRNVSADSYTMTLAEGFELVDEGGKVICDDHFTGNYSANGNVITDSCRLCSAEVGKITLTADGGIYNGQSYGAMYVSSGSMQNVTTVAIAYYDAAGNQLTAVPTEAGTYTAEGGIANHTIRKEFTIAKATLTVEMDNAKASGTYGDKLKELTVTGLIAKNPANNNNEVAGTWSISGDAVPNVGDTNEYTAVFTPAANAECYEPLIAKVKLEIAKAAPPTVKFPTAAAITYGQTLSESVLSGGTGDGTFAWNAGVGTPNAGESKYAVDFTPNDVANYDYESDPRWIESRKVLCETVKIVVHPADAEVTEAPKAATLTYTGKAQELVAEGKADGGKLVYSLSEDGTYTETIPTGTAAGAYKLWYKIVGDSNHKDTEAKAVEITIAKAALTVTANDHTVTYGDAASNSGVVYSGFVNDEKETVLSGELTYTCSYKQYDAVGSYDIAPGGLTSDNYEITFVSGKLNVVPKSIEVVANELTKTYGDADPVLTYWVDGLVNEDTMSGALEREAGEAVGTYKIVLGTLSAGDNYTVSRFYDSTLTVAKRNLTVTVKDQSIAYGQSLSPAGYTITGVTPGQTAKVTLVPSTTKVTAGGSITAKVTVTDKDGNDVAANYNISTTVGKLEIAPNTAKIEDLTADNVTSANKKDLEDVKASIADADSVKGQWTEIYEDCDELLDQIEAVKNEQQRITEEIGKYDRDSVTSADEKALEQLVKDADALLAGGNLTESEKKALTDEKTDAEALIDVIESAEEAATADKAANVTPENVKPADKQALLDDKAALEKALTDFDGNYTDAEEKIIRDRIQAISNALQSLEKAEQVTAAIKQLPATVEPDDELAAQKILAAKDAYGALTEHEKSLVDAASKEALDALVAALTAYDIVKGDGGKWRKGAKTGMSFTANGAFSKFKGIMVDTKAVDAKHYEAKAGSTIVTLKASYLETLSAGKHTLTVLFTDGQTDGTFTIEKAKDSTVPATGDSSDIFLHGAVLTFSLAVLAVLLLESKKRRAENR